MRADPVLDGFQLANDPPQVTCLTICQPWAWAIMAGHKPVENRTWTTRHRGRLAIHAGKSRQWMPAGMAFLRQLGIEPDPARLHFGALLGVVNLVGMETPEQRPDCPWSSGPQCWVLERPRLLPEPIAMGGRQGLFRVAVDSVPGLASHLK